MSPRLTTVCGAIGLAVAISLGSTSTSQAQNPSDTSSAARRDTTGRDTTGARRPSRRRIRVQKEQGTTGATPLDTSSAGGAVAPTDTTTRRDTTGMTPDTTGMRRDTTGGAAGAAAGGVSDTSRMRDTTGGGVTGAGAATDSATNRSNMSADTTTNPARTDTSGMRRDTSTSPTGGVTTDTTMKRDTTTNQPGVSADTTTNVPRSDTLTEKPDTTQTGVSATPSRDTTYTGAPGAPSGAYFHNGFYIGVGGGASVPVGNFKDSYKTGWNVTVPIGWQSSTTPWGVQLDATYNQVKGKSLSSGGSSFTLSDTKIWSGMLDLTFRIPMGAESSAGLYLLGGGGVHHFTDYGGATFTSGGTTFQSTSAGSTTRMGVNGGAGFDFPVGPLKLFAEGRYVSVFTKGKNTNYVPIVAGFKFY